MSYTVEELIQHAFKGGQMSIRGPRIMDQNKFSFSFEKYCDANIDIKKVPISILNQTIANWAEYVKLKKIKRKMKKRKNGRILADIYSREQKLYFTSAMHSLSIFYPEETFEQWNLVINSNRDILDYYEYKLNKL